MDIKGQISIEFVLILGFILVVVLGVASVAGPLIEENSITSAARQGASASLYEISSFNVTINPTRITRVIVTGTNDKNIRIEFSRPIANNYKPIILNQTMKSILNQTEFTQINNNTVQGSNRKYSIIIS
ncbi:MAG: TadE family protein [Methanobacteriaceae archaeon]|nr:TadE family protein [Methanobacteriaceae archaeon]